MLTGVVFKYLSGGLAIACLILLGLWQMDKAGAKKWKGRAEAYHAELQRITTAKDEQRKTSERNVRIVESDPGVKIVERIIRVPNAANCGTPQLDTEARELL